MRRVQLVVSAQLQSISPDGQAAQVRVRAKAAGADPSTATKVVNALQGTFAGAKPPSGLSFHLAGQIATLAANQQSSNRSSHQVQAFSFMFIIMLLLVVFRSLPAALVTLIPSGLALVIAQRIIGAEGQAGLQISSITEILLIVLMLGAGTDYGLFLVFRVREQLRDGQEPHEAVRRALVRVGESITGSAGTVILALLTLLLATFGLYEDLGVPFASGLAVMLMIGLTLLPSLLAIVGGGGSGGGQLQAIGFGLALGILMDTFPVRALLVPSVVVLLGGRNWWPSHPASEEHHERVRGVPAEAST